MAILCSQCGAQVPRPDVTRTPIVCARCATMKSAMMRDDEDMATVDLPPLRPSTAPAPRPSTPPRPSVVPRPSGPPRVGGPPGSRIPAADSPIPHAGSSPAIPRATPSVAPRPSAAPPGSRPAAPIPRAAPLPKVAAPSAPRSGGDDDYTPLETGEFEEATGDINLATGDFESIGDNAPGKPRPPRP